NLANDMVHDHDVTVICGANPHQSFFKLDPRVKLEFLGMSGDQGRSWRKFVWIARAVSRLRKIFQRDGTEIAIGVWTDYASLLPLAATPKLRTIACEHIAFEDCTGFWRWARKFAYPRCNAVVSLTAADAEHYAKMNPKTAVIPNAVSFFPQTPSDLSAKRILTIGHFINRKGFDRLLWAFKYLADRFPDWKVQIVSGGSNSHIDQGFFDHVMRLIDTLELKGRVEILPTRRNVTPFYMGASIYAMTSYREGLPMVLLEAKAFGLPVVSFDCPTGPREIVQHNVDGFLIESDIELFAQALEDLMADAELRKEYGCAARQDVEKRFSSSSIKAMWYKLFQELGVG
ncbi:MAG: glycosyltransferase family 4 protein, partial [Methylococcaceae bacterium]|nr:glycosyltransferase family 4 protein [Methylococcaceae bacterium]